MHEPISESLLCTAAYCGVKTLRSEFVQLVSSLPLLSLINSTRWLDGSLHSVLRGQSSSPNQLALATLPKTDRNITHACVCVLTCTRTYIPHFHPHLSRHTRQAFNRWGGRGKAPCNHSAATQLVRSHKIYGWQTLSIYYAFLPHLSPLLLSLTRHTFCWSCWHKLKNLIVVFKFPRQSTMVSWLNSPHEKLATSTETNADRGKVHLGNVSIMYLIFGEIQARCGGLRWRHMVGDISWWRTTVFMLSTSAQMFIRLVNIKKQHVTVGEEHDSIKKKILQL